MKFGWKLQPLQRKLAWDLELARGRVAALSVRHESAQEAVQALEGKRAEQARAALAVARRGAEPALHAQALMWLAAAENQLARLRAQCVETSAALEAARAECRRCGERQEVLAALHDDAMRQFTYDAQREAAKEADCAWLVKRAGQEAA